MVALFRRPAEPTRRSDERPQVSPLWRALTQFDRGLVRLVGRLEITGTIPEELRGRPGLIAANHIGVFDAFVLTAALRKAGVDPRFLLAGGLLDAPVVGWILRQGGPVRVDRGRSTVVEAVARTIEALRSASGPVLVYPEGRISREPGLWPERGKTGVARIALAANVPVMTISQWGAHEAVYWGTERVEGWRDLVPVVTSGLRALRARPVFRVHFGRVVDLSDLSARRPGDAVRAHRRIMEAITADLVPLRPDEPDTPRFHDPTRPTDSTSPWRPRTGPADPPPVTS
ncbi:lysophospholipid acyltransferase family protein [Actinophytocola xanthii]|uniref:1-acyl-sn-glycerol-3-phosphate acyltransferase n=1 Tax=Actinophytocola xanthii TaxID=1912961 RepID=A0A1Q8C8W9_9PSEU|nr:lysophospholipid acyltransferase family protein [Actinophytocola xanthii]OLF10800.1 1-acyl-sn-glycerol-3-phosphate acyltransferase [Actinophytocola xanthii]